LALVSRLRGNDEAGRKDVYVQARRMVNGTDRNTEIAAIAEFYEEMLMESKL
jgi:hypothetical protein